MEELEPVGSIRLPTDAQPASSLQATATDEFGLSFESLLQIILTQLTYQDPLQPIENFEFVSQLAQFSQIQQTETMSDRLLSILEAESTGQATSLLGRFVDIPSGASVLTGQVTAVEFQNGDPRLTIETSNGQTITNIGLASVSQIRLEEVN